MQWNLIRLRKENNETQSDVAKLLNISLDGYRLKETGKSQFKLNEMFIISEHYGLNLDDIFLPTKYTLSKHKVKER